MTNSGPHSATTSAPARPADDAIDPVVWRTAFTIIIGAMAVVFDTTIVSVAIHDLGVDLHAPLSTIQWVSTGYLLAMFVTIPIAGWAQAVLGGKRLWIAALAIFFLGSMLCAAAWDANSLIAFRILQGVGGGIMMPLMSTLIMQTAKGRNIGKVMATVTLPVALGPILGPVLGGLILGLGDWRWLFLVNAPFCIIGGWLAFRNLADDRPDGPRPQLDVVGLLLLSPGVAAMIYGLSKVEGDAGLASAQVLVPALVGLALVTAFVFWAVPRSERALVDLQLFRHRPLASSSAIAFLAGAALFGSMLLLPLYWQQLRGHDALDAGLLLIPQGVGTLMSRTISGRYTDRLGPRWVALVGFAVACVATIPFAFADADTSTVVLLVALFVRGFGMGAAMIPLLGAAYFGLDHSEIPHASIITRVSQQIGGSMGTAVLAVILQHAATSAVSSGGPADAFQTAFWWATGLTAIAVPLCLLLPGKPQPLAPLDRAEAEAAIEI